MAWCQIGAKPLSKPKGASNLNQSGLVIISQKAKISHQIITIHDFPILFMFLDGCLKSMSGRHLFY